MFPNKIRILEFIGCSKVPLVTLSFPLVTIVFACSEFLYVHNISLCNQISFSRVLSKGKKR